MTTGEKIRTVRQLRNMTQKQVGQKCGINEANLRKYESGRQIPKLDTLKRIAEAMDVGVEDLVSDEYDLSDRLRASIDGAEQINATLERLISDAQNNREIDSKTLEDITELTRMHLMQIDKEITNSVLSTAAYHPEDPDSILCEKKRELIYSFSALLNLKGLDRVLNYIEDLTAVPEYKRIIRR